MKVVEQWGDLADGVLAGRRISREQALDILTSPDSELLGLLQAAFDVRRRFFGTRVRIHVLVNARSGNCSEDCHFCSQSASSDTDIERYPMLSADALVDDARRAHEARAWKYCIVTAMRAPNARVIETICDAVRRIRQRYPMMICCSLGLLTPSQAGSLKEAGVDRFNHNLETSERFFPRICTTHTYADRVRTLRTAKEAGLSICSGGILGMGESDHDIVDLAMSLRDLDADSIPVNLLNPVPGTPLDSQHALTPQRCLKALALFRFVNPDKDIRVAGGREVNLRHLQPLSLYAASSIFAGGYLTTGGLPASDLHRMIEDLGFEIEEVRE